MTPIKRRLLYIFRGSLLRLRITWAGRALTLSVGYHVDRARWDGARCRRGTTHGPQGVAAAVINKVLENLERDIDAAFLGFESADAVPSPEELRAAVIRDSRKDGRSLSELADAYILEESELRHWSQSTVRSVKRSLKFFLDYAGPGTPLPRLKKSIMTGYLRHLQTRPTRDVKRAGSQPLMKAGLSNSSANRYLSFLFPFFRWIRAKGLAIDPGLLVPPKGMPTTRQPVVFLTMEELARFRAAASTDAEKRVAEAFVFACFTGLRYSDFSTLDWSQVGPSWISVQVRKTRALLSVELNEVSSGILSAIPGPRAGRVFDLPDNAHFNKATKALARRAGIDAPVETVSYTGTERRAKVLPKWHYVTSHTPRKTFVCNALSLGIPPEVVMKWTGHSTYKAMRPYIDILSEAKREAMQKLGQLGQKLSENSSAHNPTN